MILNTQRKEKDTMGRKYRFTKGDKEKTLLFASQIGVWMEFQHGHSCKADFWSFAVMTKKEVEHVLDTLQDNALHFFGDCDLEKEVVANYMKWCNKRLKDLEEVEKIRKERTQLKNITVCVNLQPDREQIEYLEKAIKAHWMIYDLFFDEAYAVNAISSETGKYYDFCQASKRLTEMKKSKEFSFLNEVDSIILQHGLRLIQNQWKYFWKTCKVTNETERGASVVKPQKLKNHNSFYTSKIHGKNNVAVCCKDCLKIPKCHNIKMVVPPSTSLYPNENLKGVEIAHKGGVWKATLFYDKIADQSQEYEAGKNPC